MKSFLLWENTTFATHDSKDPVLEAIAFTGGILGSIIRIKKKKKKSISLRVHHSEQGSSQ